MYDQEFFNKNLKVRNLSTGLFSYVSPNPLFISEGNDLDVSLEFPYFHDNDISRNLYVIPGTYNIGKHFPRTLELAAKFKRPCSVQINEGDALYYVRFHTREKIIFKKFILTNELKFLLHDNLSIKGYIKNIKTLQWWYDLASRHNYKKHILREIKKTLL
jgi:hypothetical protein